MMFNPVLLQNLEKGKHVQVMGGGGVLELHTTVIWVSIISSPGTEVQRKPRVIGAEVKRELHFVYDLLSGVVSQHRCESSLTPVQVMLEGKKAEQLHYAISKTDI